MLCYNCMKEKGDADICPYCHEQNMPAAQPHHIVPGTVIGHYTIGRALGEGGFGITYIAKENMLEITVAVKEYYPYGLCNRVATVSNTVSIISSDKMDFYEKGRDRFLKEARTLARFQVDPGVVNVVDFIEENNTAYIVMEYLDGINLREYLKQNGVIEATQAVKLLLPVMRALEKIHNANVIHRDISPDNIMVLRDGSLKLMDFGAARDFDGDDRSMSVMLKQGYAPEEQYRRNGEQGPWTDVYGICATLYRCITGSAPVDALDRLHYDDLRDPSEYGIEISAALENAILYGLALHKEERCPDVATLISCLEAALSEERTVVTTLVNGSNGFRPGRQTAVPTDPDVTAPADGYSPMQPGYRPQQSIQRPIQQPVRQEPQQPAPPQPAESRSSAQTVIIVCAVAAVVITIIVAAVILLSRPGDDVNTDSTSAATVVETEAETEAPIIMPDLVGKKKETAIKELAELNITVDDFIEQTTDDQSPGSVFSQVPVEGASINESTRVTLYIAKEKETEKPTQKPTQKPTSAPEPEYQPYPVNTRLYCVADTYVALHESNSVSSKQIRKIWKDQEVTFIGSGNGMYYVDANGVRGYAVRDYFSTSMSSSTKAGILYCNSDITSADPLYLREEPDSVSRAVAEITGNKKMTFVYCGGDEDKVRSNGYHPQWVYVKYNGEYGYVYDFWIHD